MFDAENIKGFILTQCEDVSVAYKIMTSFQFIFILHLTKEIIGNIDVLCQALQEKSQDTLNALHVYPKAKRRLLA